jgi:hypothetical protein
MEFASPGFAEGDSTSLTSLKTPRKENSIGTSKLFIITMLQS